MTETTATLMPKTERIQSSLWPAELNILFQLGHWATPDQLLSEALESLLAKYPDLRQRAALELFRQDIVSIGRAAEIAGTDQWTFKDNLRANGISIVIEVSTPGEMDKTIRAYEASQQP